MSHGSLSPVSRDDVKLIVEAEPLTLPKSAQMGLWVLLGAAVVVFIMGVNGAHPVPTWLSFQVNMMFWFAIAIASAGFSGVFHICNAQWSRPLRRIFESSAAFILWTPALLIVFYFGHEHIFVWAHEHIPGKGVWLTSDFLFLRDLAGMVFLIYLVRRIVFHSLRRDMLAIRGGMTGLPDESLERWQGHEYDHLYHSSAENAEADLEYSNLRMWRLSPLMVFVFALIMTFLSFDLIMSVDPHWYSTLFGALIFMSGIYGCFAWGAVVLAIARERHPLFRKKIERRTLHDHGKLLFGFGIFWAYMFWSHYLPIWYGNIPEETGWMIVRLRTEPWHGLAWVILGASFIIPFLLGLSRDVKQMPTLLFATGVIVLCGMWLQFYLLITPTLYPHEIPLSWRDIVITLGFMAGYLLTQFKFLSHVPLMPFGDFYLKEESGEAAAAAA